MKTTQPEQAGVAPDAWRGSLTIPPLESPFLPQLLRESGLSQEQQDGVRKLARDGYAIFDIDIPDFGALSERLIAALHGKYGPDRRVAEAWYFNDDVRTVANAPRVLEFLQLIFQRDPIPFQTLNFEVGTQQPAHSDTIHFHSLPKHYMVGAWVALEDIHPDSGPLVVYPGSHRLPEWHMQDLGVAPTPQNYHAYEDFVREALAALGYQAVPLLLKRGQVAVWLANLYHGGTAIKDPSRTRCSQASHYYFSNCQYYFPMQSDLHVGRIIRREVIDIRTGKFVQHMHEGQVVDLGDMRNVCTYPRPLPTWVH